VSDLTLKQSIMEALAANELVHADEIAVDFQPDGGVVLRGSVGSPLQRAEAARTARRVPGVTRVDNQLHAQRIVEHLADVDSRGDADTEAAVLDALIADGELHVADIDVKVDDGKVTLRGLVLHKPQRERAQRIAMAVPGVSAVHNELELWRLASPEDMSVRSDAT
jgi:osmotically-inducible protein OsmY